MKQKLLSLLCFLSITITTAQTFTINNIGYTIKGTDTELSDGSLVSGAVIIPSTVVYNGVVYPVRSIGERAFYYNRVLSSVIIPNSVTTIGGYSFYGCNSLTSISIPNSISSFGEGVFGSCTSLTSIICNIAVPVSITPGVFFLLNKANCFVEVPLSSIAAYRAAPVWKDFKGISDKQTFVINNINYTVIDGTNNVEVSPLQCFYEGDLIIPSTITNNSVTYNVTSIADKAFQYCNSISSVIIPNSVTSIGAFAFNGCSSLTSVSIPNSVKRIKESAFDFCYRLTSVTLPNSITSIEASTFKDCYALTSVTIPNSVTSIESLAFYSCTKLASIISSIQTPLKIDSTVFYNVNTEVCSLEVPASSVAAYKTTLEWKNFKIVAGTLSADEFIAQKETVLYPNPFSNELFFESNSVDASKIEVLDINGKVVLNKAMNTTDNKVDTSNLSSGIYFAKVYFRDHAQIQKVIKK